jgi:hypothetical protein
MAYYRKGDYDTAILEGHKAESSVPEQLVHTNLSLFYMKRGIRKTAEEHGLQARIALRLRARLPVMLRKATPSDNSQTQTESFKLPESFRICLEEKPRLG